MWRTKTRVIPIVINALYSQKEDLALIGVMTRREGDSTQQTAVLGGSGHILKNVLSITVLCY